MEIREFSVPALVQYGTSESVILDCNYEFGEKEREGIVIMWFFSKNIGPFLQWIPGRKPQLVDEEFRPHIDLNFTVDDEDESKKHRAIRMVDLSPKLSGTYKCKVSTFYDEDFQQKNMLVYGMLNTVHVYYVVRSRVPFADGLKVCLR